MKVQNVLLRGEIEGPLFPKSIEAPWRLYVFNSVSIRTNKETEKDKKGPDP